MSTAAGIVVGLVLFLAMALMGAVAVSGVNNPDISLPSAAAGGSVESDFPEKQPGSLRALDLNGDGRLTLAEAAGHADIVTRFERVDRNRDGKLTQAEFNRLSKLPPPKAGKKKPARRPRTTGPG